MEKEFLEEFCVCRAEFENDEIIWGDIEIENKEPPKSIFKDLKAEMLDEIPY